MLGVESMVEIY